MENTQDRIRAVENAAHRVCVAAVRRHMTRSAAAHVATTVVAAVATFKQGDQRGSFELALQLVGHVPGAGIAFAHEISIGMEDRL